MFSSAPQTGSRAPMSTMYRGVSASTSVEGASPHKLVSMLYQAVAGEIAAARGAVARSDIPEKCRAIGHAVRIVDEGLLAPLDLAAGGALALNLRDLYDYIVRRLTIANLNSDDAVLADCAGLVQTLRETWDAIAPQIEAAPRAAA
jgi:flagellar protein FliS